MIPRFIRLFSVPIILGWIALVVSSTSPSPAGGGRRAHAVSLAPQDAPSLQAMKRIGKNFQEFDSNSAAMVVLEGDQPLGADAHKYYDELINKLEADTEHVQHVQDFWGDPLTAAGAQSADGKAAYVQVYLRGQPGRDPGQRVRRKPSVRSSTRRRRRRASRPTSPAPRRSRRPAPRRRQEHQDDHAITIGVIVVMLLLVYRSIVTMLLVLVMVFIELAAARGIVAVLGYYEIIGLSTFAVNLLTMMVIAAGTDYAIFLSADIRKRAERRGPGSRVLHDVSRHGARHPGFGADDRRRDVLPELHPAAVLPDARRAAGGRHGRRGRRGADPRRPRWSPSAADSALFEPKRKIADPRLAADRHRGGAVARTRSSSRPGAGAGRPARAAGLQDRATTTASTCPPTSRPTSATPPPTGILRSRG